MSEDSAVYGQLKVLNPCFEY